MWEKEPRSFAPSLLAAVVDRALLVDVDMDELYLRLATCSVARPLSLLEVLLAVDALHNALVAVPFAASLVEHDADQNHPSEGLNSPNLFENHLPWGVQLGNWAHSSMGLAAVR